MSGPTTGRILIAGIGNIFLGDDGFGVEVVRRMRDLRLPDRVDIADYGIRGLHLAYDLLDGHHGVLILVDALPLGEPAGTLGVIDVDFDSGVADSAIRTDPDPAAQVTGPVVSADPAGSIVPEPPADAHGMDPESVLRLLHKLGGHLDRVLVVGCQPAVLDERIEMSAPVLAVLDDAARMVAQLAQAEADRLSGNWLPDISDGASQPTRATEKPIETEVCADA